jgi:hypothetical protein
MRYIISEIISNQFLGLYPFLTVFGFEEGGIWYVDERALNQIDKSGDTSLTINSACQQLFGMSRSSFFDDKLDTANQSYLLQEQKTEDGFALYKRIIGNINDSGGLNGYLDDDQMPAYISNLTALRNMLKDGFPEMALRKFVNDISPMTLFSMADEALYVGWIEALALKYGADQSLLDLLKTVPKGDYPFGANGAP